MNIRSLFRRKINDEKTVQPITPNQSNDSSSTMEVNPPVQDNTIDNNNTSTVSTDVPANWIQISEDGEFICSECGNKSAPETNTENGTVTAELEKVKSDLTQYSTKIIYGICPVCGMEFTFKHQDNSLYLEPSEMMK